MTEHLRHPPENVAVELERVVFETADGHVVLDQLDLQIGAREIVTLVGRSGAGKTTLLKLLNRLHEPKDGIIRVFGIDSREWDPVVLRRQIGYVIQEIGLFPHMTVADNIGIVPRLLDWPRSRIEKRVAELLELVGLRPERHGHRRPRQLSGGERQRVGVARALAADPPLLLLDEPFGALDPITRGDVRRSFRSIMTELGKAALFVTHDLREALEVGDRVGLLVDGRIAVIEQPEAFASSSHADVQTLMATLEGEYPARG